jgi:hypothetical protein
MAGCHGAVSVPLLSATLPATSREKDVKATSAMDGFLLVDERALERAMGAIVSPVMDFGAVSPGADSQ